jgi:diguanylate cyclase (GGDEF)-like protein
VGSAPNSQSDDRPARDELTGLLQRGALLPDLERALAENAVGYVAIFDLDGFIYANDLLGHYAGDALLIFVAALIEQAAGPARTYRAGGDEFVVVGAGLDPEAGRTLHRRVVDTIRIPLTTEARSGNTPPNFAITISGGVATWPNPAYAAAFDVLRAADLLMYREKSTKRTSLLAD